MDRRKSCECCELSPFKTVSFNRPGDQTGITDPMLGSLADNGGLTMTHAESTEIADIRPERGCPY